VLPCSRPSAPRGSKSELVPNLPQSWGGRCLRAHAAAGGLQSLAATRRAASGGGEGVAEGFISDHRIGAGHHRHGRWGVA